MAIRRRFASVPPVFVSAKTTRSRSYDALPVRAGLSLMGYPASRADKMAYGSRAEDFIGHRVTNASMFSNYALEEGYDTARQSRNRDARLLRDATDAIVSSESFATPQTSVAARRVARGQSMAPRAVSVPPRPLYPLEAAIIASKMDVDSFKGRRPRSEYAARKYRTMRLADQENIYAKSPRTAGYYASHPPLPKMTERKAIRTEEGYTKPKNILSWQYRLDSLMKPSDLLHQPSSFGRIRQQVRAAQEGMDRHRQMLDRYLPEEGAESSDAAARVLRKMAEMDKRYPVSGGGRQEEKRSHEAPY